MTDSLHNEGAPLSEVREGLLGPKMYVIYRDNVLFREVVPKITEQLTSLNYQVIEQKFPEGTPENEIADWAQAHKSELEGKFLTDETFVRSVGRAFAQNLRIYRGELDLLMDEASMRSVLGEKEEAIKEIEHFNEEDEEGVLETCRQAFIAVVRRILADPNNMPQKVLIVKDRLSDHPPFFPFYDRKNDKKAKDLI